MLDITTFIPSVLTSGLGSPNGQIATILSRQNKQPNLLNSTQCISNYNSFLGMILDAHIIIFQNTQSTIFASYLKPFVKTKI